MKKNKLSILLLLLVFVNISCSKDRLILDTDSTTKNNSNTDIYTFEEPIVSGNSFYIDPVNGSDKGNGSIDSPWKTLQSVINNHVEYYKYSKAYDVNSSLEVVNETAPVKGGDELILKTGYHGNINLNKFMFKDNNWLTIRAEKEHKPVLSQFKIIGTFKNIYLKGLYIIKDNYKSDSKYWETDELNKNNRGSLIHLESNAFHGKGTHVKMKNITLKTTENSSLWSPRNWLDKSANGLYLRSVTNVEFIDSKIENVSLGVTVDYKSDNFSIINSEVLSFSHDGMRLCSSEIKCYNNKIIGCIDVDTELPEYRHYDGIQSYSRNEKNTPGQGIIKNVHIKNNFIAMIPKGSSKKHGNLQGIGCFDGFFENWIVENNIVLTDNYHGISLYGLLNGKIINNTVLDQKIGNDRSPWVMVKDHKTNGVSKNSIVANNIVSRTISISDKSINVNHENNYIIGHDNLDKLNTIFIDLEDFNLNLKDNDITRKHIIDKGSLIKGVYSSDKDFNSITRKGLPDIGALELNEL